MQRRDTTIAARGSIDSRATVLVAANRMRDEGVERLAVLEDGCVVGQVGDREIIVRCVSARMRPSRVCVRDIMSAAM